MASVTITGPLGKPRTYPEPHVALMEWDCCICGVRITSGKEVWRLVGGARFACRKHNLTVEQIRGPFLEGTR